MEVAVIYLLILKTMKTLKISAMVTSIRDLVV